VRDFISVNDVINAIILASSSKEGGQFNVGTGRPVTIDELARRMTKIYGLHMEPVYSPLEEEKNTSGRQEIRQSYADTRKSADILKFTARKNIDSELKEMREKFLQ
jgi:nucleoside-diphosphate-sugar epimerase